MSKLFNSKTNAVPVKVATNPKIIIADDLSAIDLGIESGKEFDSMSTRSAGSHELKRDDNSDRSRLIDNNNHDGDDDDDDDNNGNVVKGERVSNTQLDFDFLNNW